MAARRTWLLFVRQNLKDHGGRCVAMLTSTHRPASAYTCITCTPMTNIRTPTQHIQHKQHAQHAACTCTCHMCTGTSPCSPRGSDRRGPIYPWSPFRLRATIRCLHVPYMEPTCALHGAYMCPTWSLHVPCMEPTCTTGLRLEMYR